MIFKTNKNGITIGGKTVDEISEDFDKLSNYISEKTSKISSDLSAVQDKINSKNSPSTWSYNELSDSNISNFDEENYSIADKIREQNEYNELLKSENSSIEAAIELSKHRVQNYDETLPKLTEINNEYEKQRQLELEDKYNSTIKERNNEYDKYLSNLNTEVEESKKVQDSIKNISPDTLGELGYKQKGYLKEIREEQQQFSDALTRVNTASVESLLPKKEDVKGYYDELLTEQREFQSQLNAIEITPIDSLKRDQYSEILSEQTDGQMALNLSASEYNDTLSTQNDLSNQRVLTLSEETDGQMALVMAENEGVSAKQKDIAETTSQIAAKEALIEASNKELLSNVNEKLAKTGATSATEELTIAKLREIAASNEEGSVLAKETLEMLGLGEASKATSIALKGLAMVGNMIAAWAIAEVLQLVVKGLDELANSVDNCKGRVDNLMSSYQTALDTANSNASRVEELASDYEKLSKGVNNLGENVSLTSEEYEQYNSLVSEIADMFPTLIQGYNDQGIAILNLKGNIEGLRDAYKEAQTEAYNTLITSGENGDGNDIIKQWEDIHDPGFFAGLFDLGSADVGGKISVSDALAQLEEIQKLTAEEYRNIENIAAAGSHKEIESLTDIQKEIGYGSYIGKALGIDENVTDEEFEKAKKQAKTLVQTYNAEIESALSDVETLANAYLMTNDDYSKLTDNSKTAASLLVNNLTKDIASDFSSKEDVGSWVDSIVSKLQNNPKLSNAINGLFTSDLSNMSVDEAKAVVDQYINTIAKILKEDPVDIKVRLGFDDYNDDDIAPLKKKVQGFLKDEFDDKVGELSLDDLQVASKFEIPEGTLLSWDELKQKIEETKNAVSEEETTISLANINKTKSGIGGLFDKYEQNEGYLTQDEVASVLETNPEYIQYLVKVGDQYKLNEQALNDWNEVNKEQKQEINNQMGGNDYLSNYSPLLDSIQDNASHPNGGVGNTNIGSQLDDLINKNKEWNTSLQNGEITTAQYFQNISNAITNSGLEDALHSLNGKFDDSTDYIEETVSVLATQLSDGLAQSTKRFEEGQTSVQDYIEEINAGSDAEKKLLASTYDLNISQETGKASLDGLSGAALEAAQNYNSLVDSQNALASTSGFVDVLSQNAEFLSQYTDEAGNLMDSIFDDSRFNDYISNMSNSIVDFANQNTTTMGDVANWLAETAGISTDQATSIIAQGGEAVQEAVGGSLNGVQSMTSFAMSQVGTAAGNAASAVGSVLSSLGQMISSFSYKITAKPFIQGKSKFDWNPKTGFDVSLPTFGFDIKGSGGKSVKSFSTSLGKAGEALNKYGASQNASAAFNNINSYKPKRKLSTNKPSSYRPTYKPKSSGKSGGGSKSPSSGSGSGSEKEPTKKDYDWIETLISRINRQVSNLGKTVSATYKTWSTRNNALAQELGSVNQQISAEQQAYNKYMQLANSVGLPEGYASLVRNGTIDVSTIQDDDLNDKIEKYQNYYNKALEASDAVQDLQDKLAELAKTKFDNVNSEYEAQLKQIDHSINVYDKMIDTAETQGYITSQKYYNALISTESSNISKLQLQYSSLTSARNEAMKAGNIAKYSEEWYSMTDSINSVEEAIQDANKSLIEYKNNLRQVKWDFFDKQEDYISKLQDESDWLINLITTENKLFNSDNGKITSSGKAVEGLHAINYNAYMTQADDYAKEIKKIDAEIANDPANTTLIERRQELLEQQRDMIKSAEDEKSAIKDLVSDGYDALSKALKKIADNYLDALNAQKDLYDYAKTIREQTKAVAQYEKQLEAIKNDTSEEAKAQIQQIKVKLEDAKQDLADSEYNQWISDQQNIVDTFESDLEDWINSRLDDLDELVQNVIDQTNTSASEINDVIEKEAGDVGYTVSDAISKVMDVDSTNGTNMVNFYDKTFPNEMTTTRNSIDAIKNLLQAMKDAADKKAQEEIKKQQAAQQAISNPASSSSSSSSSSSNSHSSNNSGSSSSSSGWGSWFVHKADSYPKSKLRINSSIVDRLKLHNFDSSNSARAGYYKAMGGSGTYVGSASQNNWMISEMKKHGFKQGGTIGKLIRSTGEDGFVLARTGEEILSNEKLIMLKDALQYIPQNFNIASTSLPKFTQKASNSSVDVKVDFGGITMNGVNNPEEFVTELQKSKRFEKIVQSITVDTAMGKNSLGKYRF